MTKLHTQPFFFAFASPLLLLSAAATRLCLLPRRHLSARFAASCSLAPMFPQRPSSPLAARIQKCVASPVQHSSLSLRLELEVIVAARKMTGRKCRSPDCATEELHSQQRRQAVVANCLRTLMALIRPQVLCVAHPSVPFDADHFSFFFILFFSLRFCPLSFHCSPVLSPPPSSSTSSRSDADFAAP